MFHIAEPAVSDLTLNDVSELRAFADAQIAAGHFIQGQRLHTLLSIYVSASAKDYAKLLEENETLARELHKDLKNTHDQIEALDAQVVSAVDTIAETLAVFEQKVSTKSPKSTLTALDAMRLASRVDAVSHFKLALDEIHEKLSATREALKSAVEDCDEIATPIEPKKPEQKPSTFR